jgi:hypothetical protein
MARVWVAKRFEDEQGEHLPGEEYDYPVDTPEKRNRFAIHMHQSFIAENPARVPAEAASIPPKRRRGE